MNDRKCILTVFCVLMLSAFVIGVSAQESVTIENLLSAPYPMNLVSANNADRIAWVFNEQGARNIWTAAAPDFVPVNLTGFVQDEVFEIPEVAITDDGSIVVYVLGGYPDRQGWVTNPKSDPDGFEQAIWAVGTGGGKPWKVARGNNPVLSPDGEWALFAKDGQIYITSLKLPGWIAEQPKPQQLFYAAGSNGSSCWSPDGSKIAFVSRRGDHSFIGIYNKNHRKITWMAPSVDFDSNPAWSADGKTVAFFRRPGAQFDNSESRFTEGHDIEIWTADVKTGKGKRLWFPHADEDPKFYTFRFLTVTKNNRVLFTAEHDNWNHVFSMPLYGGSPVDLTPGEGFVEHLDVSSDGKTLYFSSNIADIHGRHIWKVPTAGGRMMQLTKGATIGTYPVALASGRMAVYLYATARHPTSVAVVPSDGGKTRVIAPRELPDEYPIDELIIPELVMVTAADGLEIPCQIFLPKGAQPGDNRPAVLYTHGGPVRQMLLGWHYMEFYSEAYAINQLLAHRGFVVISVNYRSGIGYGRKFRLAENRGARGASEYQDVVAGGKYLKSIPEVDPERIGLWGLSYGGVLTATGLARNSDMFKAGVDMAGVHDWTQFGRGRRGGLGGTGKVAFESSAIANVDDWKSPVLFIHGDDDRNVPFQQTTDLVQKLRARGVHIELMIYPDEPHEMLLEANKMEVYNATIEFLERFLKK